MTRSAYLSHWGEPKLRLHRSINPGSLENRVVGTSFMGEMRVHEKRDVGPTRYVVARFVLSLVESHLSASSLRAGANSGQL
jgi:hypothetical protein